MSKYLTISLFMAIFMAVIALCATIACSQQDDNAISGVGGYLDTGDNSARQDIKAAFGEEDLFNPGKSRSNLGTGKKAAVAVTRDMLPSAAAVKDASIASQNVAGRWSLMLTDSMTRSVNIMLAQSDDAVFGRGYMIYGNATQEVTATGSISGSRISLDLLALKDMNLYRMELNLQDRHLSGDYTAYSASTVSWSGEAEGNIT